MTRLVCALLLLVCGVIVASRSQAQPAAAAPTATNQGAPAAPTANNQPATEPPAATAPTSEQPAATAQPTHPGIPIYRANYCGICHELPAADTHGAFGPTHAGMGATAAQRLEDPSYGGRATTPAEYLAESILEPAAFLVPGYATSAHPMPSFAHLPEADIAALVELLLAQ